MSLDETIARLESKNVSETERLRAALEARPQVFIGVDASQIVQLGAGGTDRDRWMAFFAEFGIAATPIDHAKFSSNDSFLCVDGTAGDSLGYLRIEFKDEKFAALVIAPFKD